MDTVTTEMAMDNIIHESMHYVVNQASRSVMIWY